MKKVFTICSLLLLATATFSQSPATELDFWLGDWDLRWQDTDSTEATGTNSITRELDGKVICEHFNAPNGKFAGYVGRSWSVYDTRAKTWKQTWVDNQGGYLDLIGGKDGETFVFSRQFTRPDSTVVQQKMVFHDIQDDQFTWDWMGSTDGGKTWNLLWQIFYKRRP